jgi:hypothetical protein
MDERFESAVYISQLVESADAGGWRRRRPVQVYRWHLIHAERALTWCGLSISYRNPRRPWSTVAEDRRCQNCVRRLERVNQAQESQRTG